MDKPNMDIPKVVLPDGRILKDLKVHFVPRLSGNYFNPPESPEITNIFSGMCNDYPLTETDMEEILDDDDCYMAILNAADEIYDNVMNYVYEEEFRKRSDNDD